MNNNIILFKFKNLIFPGVYFIITSQMKNKFNVSVAEVGDHSRWQLTTIGLVVASNDKRRADEVLAKVIAFIDSGRFDVEVLSFETELITV